MTERDRMPLVKRNVQRVKFRLSGGYTIICILFNCKKRQFFSSKLIYFPIGRLIRVNFLTLLTLLGNPELKMIVFQKNF